MAVAAHVRYLWRALKGNRLEIALCLEELDKPALMQSFDWRMKLSSDKQDAIARRYSYLLDLVEAEEGSNERGSDKAKI